MMHVLDGRNIRKVGGVERKMCQISFLPKKQLETEKQFINLLVLTQMFEIVGRSGCMCSTYTLANLQQILAEEWDAMPATCDQVADQHEDGCVWFFHLILRLLS